MKTAFAALISLFFLGTAHADTAAMEILAQNLGERTGTLEDGSDCSLAVTEGNGSYTVHMKGAGFDYVAYADESEDTKNYFDKPWLRSYLTATNGGWLTSKMTWTDSWEMRLQLSKGKIESFKILESEATYVCTLQ